MDHLPNDSFRASTDLTPFVPRLLLDWQVDDPTSLSRSIEGSLVFIDLSGFTALSERLSKRGKIGAEELTDVLNEKFSDLLEVAYDAGGSLVKFGGDALLIFFSGDAHTERSAAAAVGMRSTLRRIGRIKTSAGAISLRMTVGIHTGRFHFFLVGRSHRELVIAGPEASETVRMESAAEAGEILVSPAVADVLGEEVLGEERGGGRLLLKAPRIELPGTQSVDGSLYQLDSFLPTAIREQILGGGEESEHRQVTVAFIHFDGTDTLVSQQGDATTAAKLDSLVSSVQEAAEEFGVTFVGTDIDIDGGKVILAAGAPRASENHEERMLRAVRRLADQHLEVPIRVGVHRGHVFAGFVGPPYRRTYTIMGDAVNTAARVMSKAASGEVLATSETLDHPGVLFERSQVEPLHVKGKSEPLTACRVGQPISVERGKSDKGLPIVGRDAEIGALVRSLEEAKAGRGQVVEVIGEAGIGKSRLIEEILSKFVDDQRLFYTEAHQYESSTPFFAFKPILKDAFAIGPDLSPPAACDVVIARLNDLLPEASRWAPLLGLVMDVPIPSTPEVEAMDPDLRRERLQQTALASLEALVPGPALWVFEDAHWMDEASRGLLQQLALAAEARPWLVCVTAREASSDEPIVPAAVRLNLSGLDEDDSSALARTAAGGELLPQHAEVLARRAGGHPLFLLELVAAFGAEADLSALPDSVEAVISARIDQLAPRDRVVLRHLSVLGREMELAMLEDLYSGTDDNLDQETVERLGDFIERKNGTLRFKQALFRDVAYEGLPFRRRRDLHEQVGTRIEARADDPSQQAELLALHFDRAGNLEKTWTYSNAAADRAMEKFSFIAAASFYRRALEVARRLKDRGRRELLTVWESLGFASLRSGQFLEATRAYASARKLAGEDRSAAARLAWREGLARVELGNYSQALRWYGRGMRALDSFNLSEDEKRIRVALGVASAEARLRQGRFAECIRLCETVVAEAKIIDDKHDLALAYYVLLNAYNDLGDDESATRCGHLALSLFEELGDLPYQARVLNSLGIRAYLDGNWELSRSLYERAGKAFTDFGHVLGAAIAMNNVGEILSDQRRWEEAARVFREALATATATKHSRLVSYTQSNLGRLHARQGRHDEAEALLSEALDEFRHTGAVTQVVETTIRLAENLVMQSRGTEALELLDQDFSQAAPTTLPMLHRIRGYALLQSGDPAGAKESFLTSLAEARDSGLRFEEALALEGLSALGPANPDAAQHRSEASRILNDLGVVSSADLRLGAT